MPECNCGAATDGKWADIHAPSCPAISVTQKIEELIRYNCSAVEGWPVKIEGIENAAAAIYAFMQRTRSYREENRRHNRRHPLPVTFE